MSQDVVVKVDRVSVRYGDKKVLDDISFEVPRGSVYALLGRNGAGKSSLMRCLLGLQRPEEGSVIAFGEDVWRNRARVLDQMAYVPETCDAPDSLRVRDVISYHQATYSRWDMAGVRQRLSRFGVSDASALGTLSRGQRALFMLSLALGSGPKLLILDDPTLGLDVIARNEFFSDFVGDLADRETTVIVTTHDLQGVEGIADRVGILNERRLVINDVTEQLKLARGQSLEQIFTDVAGSLPRSA